MAKVRHRCKVCGRTDEEIGPVSKRGYCGPCGRAAYEANLVEQRAKAGVLYDRGVSNWVDAGGASGRPITPY